MFSTSSTSVAALLRLLARARGLGVSGTPSSPFALARSTARWCCTTPRSALAVKARSLFRRPANANAAHSASSRAASRLAQCPSARRLASRTTVYHRSMRRLRRWSSAMRWIHALRRTSRSIGANTTSRNSSLLRSEAQQLSTLDATSSATSALCVRTSSSSRSFRWSAVRHVSIAAFTARYPSCL